MKLSLKQLVNIYGRKAGNLIYDEQNAEFIERMVAIIKRQKRLENLIPKQDESLGQDELHE